MQGDTLVFSFLAALLSLGIMIPGASVISTFGKNRQKRGLPPRRKWFCVLYTVLLWLASTIITTLVVSLLSASFYSSYVPSVLLSFWAYRIISNGHGELKYYKHELVSFREYSKILRNDSSFKRERFETITDQDDEIFRRWEALESPVSANAKSHSNGVEAVAMSEQESIKHNKEESDTIPIESDSLSVQSGFVYKTDTNETIATGKDNTKTLSNNSSYLNTPVNEEANVHQRPSNSISSEKPNGEHNVNEVKMFCRKCGARLSLDSAYCNKCGKKVKIIR